MDMIYESSSLNDVYIETVVHDIRPGSLTIDFESIFHQAVNPDRPFREEFRTFMEEQVATGSIGELPIVPFTLHVYNNETTTEVLTTSGLSSTVGTTKVSITKEIPATTGTRPTTPEMSTTTGTPTIVSATTDTPTTTVSTTTDTPTTTEVSTTTDTPTTTEMSTTTDTPTTTESTTTTVTTTDSPTTTVTTTTDTPTTTEMSATTDGPTTTEMSTTTDTPTTTVTTTTDTPTTTELSTTTDTPTTTELSTTTDTPTTTELSTTTDTPTTDTPTTTELLTTTDTPTTTEMSTPETPVLHCHRYEYHDFDYRVRMKRGSNRRRVACKRLYGEGDYPFPNLFYCFEKIDEPGPVNLTNGKVCPDNETVLFLDYCDYLYLDHGCDSEEAFNASCPSVDDLYDILNETFGTGEPPFYFPYPYFIECLTNIETSGFILTNGFECPVSDELHWLAICYEFHSGSDFIADYGDMVDVCDGSEQCPSFYTLSGNFSSTFGGALIDGEDGGCGCGRKRRRRSIDDSSHHHHHRSKRSNGGHKRNKNHRECYSDFPFPRFLYCYFNNISDSAVIHTYGFVCPAFDYDFYYQCDGIYLGAYADDELVCPCWDSFNSLLNATFGTEAPPDCLCHDLSEFGDMAKEGSVRELPYTDRCGFVDDFPFPRFICCLLDLYNRSLPFSNISTDGFVCPDEETLLYFEVCLDVLTIGKDHPDDWNTTCPCAQQLYQEFNATFGTGFPPNFEEELNRGCICYLNESYDGERFDELDHALDTLIGCSEEMDSCSQPSSELPYFDECLEFFFGDFEEPTMQCPTQTEFLDDLISWASAPPPPNP
ncbi:uncharacterized protein [Asterias amurensis]|uniref:uncharacterized protein n=1 Tax=Asterias amurensis TaxID=7602 RepID=UPI003AB5860C